MTVNTTTSSVQYTGDATTTEFAVTFDFYVAADLVVTERVIATGVEAIKELTTDYTVSGGSGGTGTVTATSAPASTVTWTIARNIPQTQLIDYVENSAYPASTAEEGLDRGVMLSQDLNTDISRALRFPVTDLEGLDGTIPNSVDRAGKALTFDGSGEPTATTLGSDSLTSVSTWYRNTILPGLEGGITKLFNAAAYGATGDGTTDDTAALQSVIDAAEAVTTLEGGGVVWLPVGTYKITDELTVQKPISIIGSGPMGWEYVSTIMTPTTVIAWDSGTTGTGKACIKIWTGNSNYSLEGMRFSGFKVAAGSKPDYAVEARAVRNSEFDLQVSGGNYACFRLASTHSGSHDLTVTKNRIRLTGGVLSGSEHMFVAEKHDKTSASPQIVENEIFVQGVHDDGDLVRMVDGESNLITAIGAQQSGGTGYALRFTSGTNQKCLRNVASYVRGAIEFGSSVNVGNVVEFQDPTTTGATTGSAASGAVFRLNTLSATNGGLWRSHAFKWVDEMDFPASRLTGTPSDAATLDTDGFYSFSPSADENVYFVFRVPYDWDAGTITAIKLIYSMSTAAAGAVALEVATAELSGTHPAASPPALTARYDAAQTVSAAANTFALLTLEPSVSWAIIKNGAYYVRVKRKGTAGGDTHGGNFQLWDLRIEYTATGPTGSDAKSAMTN